MTAPRRRIVRPTAVPPAPEPNRPRRLQRLRTQLEKERTALTRWMARLKRSFNQVLKRQRTIARTERQITQLEEP